MKDAKQIKQDLEKRIGRKRLEFKAVLGRADGQVKSLEVGASPEDVYITLYNGSVITCHNDRVPRVPLRKVVVGYDDKDPNLLQVLRFDNLYTTRPHPNVANHKDSHAWFGYDPVEAYGEQIMPLLPRAAGGLNIRIHGGNYFCNGSNHILPNTDIDLTAEAVSSGAEWVNIEIDESGAITYNHGVNKASRALLLPEDIPATSTSKKLLCSVKMYAGQSVVIQTKTDTDIYDPRFSGVGGGGLAGAVYWDDVLSKPVVFPPDTSVTDALYPRKWMFFSNPTIDDDGYNGYGKLDFWLNQSSGSVFVCLDDTVGAAVWVEVGGGNAGNLTFVIDGALAVNSSAAVPILITQDITIGNVFLFCEEPGSSGSTIADIVLDGVSPVSIFSGVCDAPPELAYNNPTRYAWAEPTMTQFQEGDVLMLDLTQVADGARGLMVVIQVQSAGGGGTGFNLSVTDGDTEIDHVGQILFDNAVVTDMGDGVARVSTRDFYAHIQDQKANGTDGGTFTVNTWTTRTLNTIVSDVDGICSISSNRITLQPGTYRIHVIAPAYEVRANRIILYNYTDSSVVVVGLPAYSFGGSYSPAHLIGRFTISGAKEFEIRHICEATQATYGLGVAMGSRASNDDEIEIYTDVEIWKEL